MSKGFFEDMVRIKREGKILDKKDAPVKEKPIEKTPEKLVEKVVPRVPEPRETRTENTEFASVYDLSGRSQDGGSHSRGIWSIAGVCIVVFLFALSFLFSQAKVTLEPKTVDLALNKNFFAAKGNLTNDLSFDLVVVGGEEKKTIAGTEEKEVAQAAEGVAIIYNNFSSATQRLDINTRLEGSNGKIYKTKKAITVPGRKSDGTPGSVEVGIYAAEAGATYNSAPLDFTIFGFKGTPKYSKFYARSKGEIQGGFLGKSRALGAAEQEQVFAEMRKNLEIMLFQKVNGSIPSGFILFDGATSLVVEKETAETVPGNSGEVALSVSGTLYGFLLEEERLTRKIAETTLENYDGNEVYIANIQDLDFSIHNQDAISFKDTNNITFNLAGNATLVWKLDGEEIIPDLLGRRKKEFPQVLSGYSSVKSGDVSLSPFWRRSFPEKAEDIKLIINYPK